MAESYTRIIAGHRNREAQGFGSLMGICTGLMADRVLNDHEIAFLKRWLQENDDIATTWPGDVIHDRVKAVLADGIVTEDERKHLVETLDKLCGAAGMQMPPSSGAVNQLMFDEPPEITFRGVNFCVTGDFVYGPRNRVEAAITERGGLMLKGVTKKLGYLVVGLRGSGEWKHGSYGTKVEKAVEYKRAGQALYIVNEQRWSAALRP